MGKGLPRSLKNAPPADVRVPVLRDYTISGSIDITGAAGLVDAGTFVLGDLPEGYILLLGAIVVGLQVDATGDAHVIDNFDGDFGIGTIPNADLDLADAGDDNIIPSTAIVAGVSDKIGAPTGAPTSTGTENGTVLDNSDGSLELNFNLLIDDNVITDTEDGTFAVSGTLRICYLVLGDD